MTKAIEELVLSRPPLVEAIFELRWTLRPLETGGFRDPNYSIFVGRFQSVVEQHFPFWEKLPTASFPEDVLPYTPQHRFRKGQNQWPLLQIGPGVLTVNDTQKYRWSDFKQLIVFAVDSLLRAYPDSENFLRIHLTHLRYLNAQPLPDVSIGEFLHEKMSVNVQLPKQLFEQTGVSDKAEQSNLEFAFVATDPPGLARLSFRPVKNLETGAIALMWETTITAEESKAPEFNAIGEWVEKARAIAHYWFLTLTEKHLLKDYR